jgi:gliotoxin/aspirochlorine/mycotoxins biosynthesis cytochrome P450 monooxygenase
MDEMLMANLDVTTHVLTWCITLVADNDEAQRQLRDEVAANKGSFHEYLAKSDTHLHRCFYEALRLRPLASELYPSPRFLWLFRRPHLGRMLINFHTHT